MMLEAGTCTAGQPPSLTGIGEVDRLAEMTLQYPARSF